MMIWKCYKIQIRSMNKLNSVPFWLTGTTTIFRKKSLTPCPTVQESKIQNNQLQVTTVTTDQDQTHQLRQLVYSTLSTVSLADAVTLCHCQSARTLELNLGSATIRNLDRSLRALGSMNQWYSRRTLWNSTRTKYTYNC